MRLTRLALAALVLLVLAPAPDRVAVAEEEPLPPGMTEDQVRVLRGKLRSRASEWWRYRKKLAMRCPQCKGVGQVRWRRGRRRVLVDCPKCDGHKMHVDKDVYRRCFYDMRSPAFRLQEGVRARVTQEYLKAKQGQPFPVVIKRYVLKKIEIVDATHGIVWIEKNKDSVARPQEWIQAEEVGKSAKWYLYDPEADGAWAGIEEPAREADPAPEPEPPAPAPPVEAPAQPEPAPTPPAPRPDEHPRDEREASVALVKRWGEERNDIHARVIRVELGLEEVEGHEKKVADARTFLAEVEGWLVEAKPFCDQARKEVEEQGLGLRLDHRLKINTLYFRAHRRLELVEKMLVAVLPDLRD